MTYLYTFFIIIAFHCSYVFASPSAEKGKGIYNANCWFCHGQRGDGKSDASSVLKPMPKDFTDPKTISELSIERMVTSITDGRKGTAMPSFKNTLKKDEIEAVAIYIKDVIMKGKPVKKAYEAHSGTYNAVDFKAIAKKGDIKICLLHCHMDEKFIRERLKDLKH